MARALSREKARECLVCGAPGWVEMEVPMGRDFVPLKWPRFGVLHVPANNWFCAACSGTQLRGFEQSQTGDWLVWDGRRLGRKLCLEDLKPVSLLLYR